MAETIYDPTGVRRFWEIKSRAKDQYWDEVSKTVWEQINKLDYLAMWQSVNEHSSSPILPHLKEIRTYQDSELRNRDSVELFVEEELEVLTRDSNQNEWSTASDLYQTYKSFCEREGITPLANQTLGKRLSSLGIPHDGKTRGGRKYALKFKQKEPPKYSF